MPEIEVRELLRIRCEYCRTRVCMDKRGKGSSPACYGDCVLNEEMDEPATRNPAAGVELLVAAMVDRNP